LYEGVEICTGVELVMRGAESHTRKVEPRTLGAEACAKGVERRTRGVEGR